MSESSPYQTGVVISMDPPIADMVVTGVKTNVAMLLASFAPTYVSEVEN
jgi:hypothetical protein